MMIKIVRYYRGDALTETLISLLALIPLFIIIPYIGKYLDVKDKAAGAIRYLTWERTILSDPTASWGAVENSVSDARLNQQVAVRVLGDPREPIFTLVDGTADVFTPNPLWVDYKADNLVSLGAYGLTDDDPDAGNPSDLTPGALLFERQAPILYSPSVETLAFGVGAGDVDLIESLDLNEQGFVSGSVSIPMLPIPEFERKGIAIDIKPPDTTTPRVVMPASGAILTDSWVPGSEDNFAGRTDGLVTDEILQLLVAPGTYTFGNTLLFNEGRKGQDPQLESTTTVLPEKYVD